MIYLILAVLCSASMAVALRLSEEYSSNKYAILMGNYVTCTMVAFLLLPEKQIIPTAKFLMSASDGASGVKAAMTTAMAAGVLNGIFFLGTLLLLQYSIRKNGAVLSSAFAKLGIMLPVAASILFLNERPTVLQTAGMALVVAAILVINLEKGKEGASAKMALLVLFVFSGAGDGMSKVFEHIGERRFDALFLFYTFLTALILCLIPMLCEVLREKRRLKAVDIISGIFVGIPNYFSTSLLLAAVTRLPAYLAYPCFSVGTILIVCFVSVLILKDKMTRRQVYGCGMILLALVLLNL